MMMTYGFILASICYAYLYWRFHRWMKRKARQDDLKLEAERLAQQQAIIHKYHIKEGPRQAA